MLKDKAICLRGLELEDLQLLHDWMNNFDLITNLLRIEPSIKYFTQLWYEKINKDTERIILAIDDVETTQFIGCIGVNNINYIDRKAELYIYIGNHTFRGKGYAYRAINLFIKYMFNYYNLNRIYLNVREDNVKGINLYKKVGFKQEGILRNDKYIDGKYINIIKMGILKGELNYE